MINRAYFINKGALCRWIQEAFNVQVNDPVIAPASLSRLAYCLQCRLPRPIPVRICMKQRVHYRLQPCFDDLLCDSIRDCGNAQFPFPTVFLWYLYRSPVVENSCPMTSDSRSCKDSSSNSFQNLRSTAHRCLLLLYSL